MLTLFSGLALADPAADPTQALLEEVRTSLQLSVVAGRDTPFCGKEHRAILWATELLCSAAPTVTTTGWRAPGKDSTWTVTLDTLRFADDASLRQAKEALLKLTPALGGYERPDGTFSPVLSWCETSYSFVGDAIVVSSVACGARRPYCAVTRALMEAAKKSQQGSEPLGVVGFGGGVAVAVPSLEVLSSCLQNKPGL